jgi:hypothetical protein
MWGWLMAIMLAGGSSQKRYKLYLQSTFGHRGSYHLGNEWLFDADRKENIRLVNAPSNT